MKYIYLIWYSEGRFGVEFPRNDFRGTVGGVLSTSRFISLFGLALGIALFVLFARQTGETEAADHKEAL